MKANAPKRKIFDALDLMEAESSAIEGNDGISFLAIKDIKPFHDHPFHLYEGGRLEDMVESIREHGVLNPVIVRTCGDGYEMLAGHNRMNAANLVGLKEIPAIVKADLSDEDAYVYVIETNMIQRSFADLLPSEKAAVIAAHYDKVCCQGKRNDIIKELQLMNGIETEKTCGHNGHRLKSRDRVADEYGLSSRNVARYLRINYLIRPYKDLIDKGNLALLAAVDLSYLSEDEQRLILKVCEDRKVKMKPKLAELLRSKSGELTESVVEEILETMIQKKKPAGVQIQLSSEVCEKYMKGMNAEQMTEIMEQALANWYERKDEGVV